MRFETFYNLADGVQVRQEVFGLLFYNYQGPRLYFVPSEDLIEDHFFTSSQSTGQLIESICSKHKNWPRQWIQDKVEHILEMLKGKGLVYEQSVC